MIPVLVCWTLVEKYSILDQGESRWTEQGQKLVSVLEAGPSQTRLPDIMKAAGEPAVSRCAASNRSQMFCWLLCCTQTPPWAPTGLLTGSSAALTGSLSCSDLSEV